jgi:hypothetical protein
VVRASWRARSLSSEGDRLKSSALKDKGPGLVPSWGMGLRKYGREGTRPEETPSDCCSNSRGSQVCGLVRKFNDTGWLGGVMGSAQAWGSAPSSSYPLNPGSMCPFTVKAHVGKQPRCFPQLPETSVRRLGVYKVWRQHGHSHFSHWESLLAGCGNQSFAVSMSPGEAGESYLLNEGAPGASTGHGEDSSQVTTHSGHQSHC